MIPQVAFQSTLPQSYLNKLQCNFPMLWSIIHSSASLWTRKSYHVSFSKLFYLGYLSERITNTSIHQRYTIHRYFHQGSHKGENPANFLKIVLSQRSYHKMIKPNKKKSSATSYLSSLSLSLSHANLSEWVCINEGGHLSIYTFQGTDLIHDWCRPLTLIGPTSPRETPKIHYMMLH